MSNSSSPLNGLPNGNHTTVALNGLDHSVQDQLINGFHHPNHSNYAAINGVNGTHEQILEDEEVRHGFGSINTALSEDEQKAGHFLYWTEVSH